MASQVREQSKRGPKELNAARAFFSGAPARSSPTSRAGWRSRPNLRTFAGLEREVVVVGVYSRIEIWDRDRWLELDRVGAAGARPNPTTCPTSGSDAAPRRATASNTLTR